MGVLSALRPYIHEGIRVGIIMAVGDVVAQTVVEKHELRNVDVYRTAKFAAVGFVFVGPVLRRWYTVLNKTVSPDQSRFQRGFKMMALDQVCFAPVFTGVLMGIFGAINGDNMNKIQTRLERDYVTVMKNNYKLWPAAQIINFSLVPIQYQVVYVQIVAIIWNAYLSTVLNK